MKKEITTCDSCGKEVKQDYFKECTIDFHLDEWGGGSLGGDEDLFDIHADLCENCAHKLHMFLTQEMNLKKNKNTHRRRY